MNQDSMERNATLHQHVVSISRRRVFIVCIGSLVLSACVAVPANYKAFDQCEKIVQAVSASQSIEIYDAASFAASFSDSKEFQSCRVTVTWSGFIKMRGYIDNVLR